MSTSINIGKKMLQLIVFGCQNISTVEFHFDVTGARPFCGLSVELGSSNELSDNG